MDYFSCNSLGFQDWNWVGIWESQMQQPVEEPESTFLVFGGAWTLFGSTFLRTRKSPMALAVWHAACLNMCDTLSLSVVLSLSITPLWSQWEAASLL